MKEHYKPQSFWDTSWVDPTWGLNRQFLTPNISPPVPIPCPLLILKILLVWQKIYRNINSINNSSALFFFITALYSGCEMRTQNKENPYIWSHDVKNRKVKRHQYSQERTWDEVTKVSFSHFTVMFFHLWQLFQF